MKRGVPFFGFFGGLGVGFGSLGFVLGGGLEVFVCLCLLPRWE